jgi:iron complex outermembrane receptor protein
VDDANSAFAPAFTLVGLRVDGAARVLGIALEPYVGIDNVFDRRHVAAVTVNAFGGRFYEPGPGRSWYGGVRVSDGIRGAR